MVDLKPSVMIDGFRKGIDISTRLLLFGNYLLLKCLVLTALFAEIYKLMQLKFVKLITASSKLFYSRKKYNFDVKQIFQFSKLHNNVYGRIRLAYFVVLQLSFVDAFYFTGSF